MKRHAVLSALFMSVALLAAAGAGFCDEAAPAPPETANAAKDYFDAGNRFFKRGEFETAIVSYQKTVEVDPKFATAYNNMGVAQYNLGLYQEAVASYDKAIELAPGSAETYLNKGNALTELGRYDDAAAAYDKAVQVDPKYALAYNCKGTVLGYLDRWDSAVDAYDKAIKADPNLVQAYNNKGYALVYFKNYDKAIELFNKALAINNKYRFAKVNLAFALLKRNKGDDAQSAKNILEGIIGEDSKDAAAAMAYALLGKKDEMMVIVTELTTVDPRLKKDLRHNLKFEAYRADPDFKAVVGE